MIGPLTGIDGKLCVGRQAGSSTHLISTEVGRAGRSQHPRPWRKCKCDKKKQKAGTPGRAGRHPGRAGSSCPSFLPMALALGNIWKGW